MNIPKFYSNFRLREIVEEYIHSERDRKILIRKDEQYRIKQEFIDLWGDEANAETIISGEDLEMIASGWDKTIDEIIDQLELV